MRKIFVAVALIVSAANAFGATEGAKETKTAEKVASVETKAAEAIEFDSRKVCELSINEFGAVMRYQLGGGWTAEFVLTPAAAEVAVEAISAKTPKRGQLVYSKKDDAFMVINIKNI